MTAEFWDERYRHPNFLFGYKPNDFLRESATLLRAGSRVLCLGDGEGRNSVWLAGQGHHVTALDFSEVAVSKAREHARDKGVDVDFVVQDLAAWAQQDGPDEPWDAVVQIFCHLGPELRRAVAETATRHTAPGGTLIYEAYTPAQPALGTGGPKDRELLMTRDEVVADWPGWTLDVRLLERRIFEGMGHQGLSSVVQALGRRRN